MTGPTFATRPTATAPAAPRAPRPQTRPGDKPDDGAGMRVLIYLRLHWLMILFCGTLLGAAGAAAAWELLASKYESYGMLQVSSVPIQLANQNNQQQARTDFSTYMKTTAALIKSEFVLNAALRDLKDTPTIKAQKDPRKYLDEELMVTPLDGAEVIRITFKGHEPDDAKKIVDAVQNAFIEQVVEKKARETREHLGKIEEARNKMQTTLNERSTKRLPGAAGAPATGAAGAGGLPPVSGLVASDKMNLLNPGMLLGKYAKLQESVEITLPLAIADAKRQHDLLKERLENIQKAPTPPFVIERIDADPKVLAAKARMVDSQAQMINIESNSKDLKLPDVVKYRRAYEADYKRWEEIRAEKLKTVEEARRMEVAKPVAGDLEKVIGIIQRYTEQLDKNKESLKVVEKQVMDLPVPVEKASGGVVPARFESAPYLPDNSDLEVNDGMFRQVIMRQLITKLEVDSPSRVTILQAASHPMQKDTKKQALGTGFAGVMGFVLMALGVIGYETMSRRVSSLADVKSSVSAPVVGVIPCSLQDATAAGGGGRDPVRRAATNEAIDKLRAYVSQTWLSRGATTIAVTSPIGDEGKAFAAFGLASSLSQAGYKTLLVDFDLREPAIHPYAGVPNLAGVCELLRAETDLRSVVQFLPSGLHLLPAGKWSDEARKAATGEKLEAVLAKMKEPYDCVVIHGHALLTVAESVEVARRCEVVLVCAKYRETATPLLKRAAERVTTMEIPYSGVVYIGATDQESLC